MTLGKALQTLWIAPFVAAGWTCGTVVKLIRLARAAVIEGYQMGSRL